MTPSTGCTIQCTLGEFLSFTMSSSPGATCGNPNKSEKPGLLLTEKDAKQSEEDAYQTLFMTCEHTD